jgi:hypothetical protein
MARKGIDPKAKEKKQKKIAIAGIVLLIALMAYEGPKTLKLMNPGPPPQSSTAPAPGTTAPVTPGATPAPTAPSDGSAGTSGLPPSGADGLVVNADLSPVPLDGQLVGLTQFTSKDPFAQQATVVPPVDGSGTPTPTGPTGSGTTTTPGGSSSFTPPASGSSSSSGSSSGSGSSPPAAKPIPTIATFSVNGVEMAVGVKQAFPADSPFFKLVALTSTSARIGIAGGSLATGSPTVTLTKGKAVTLMNTADGTRYVIVLVSFGDTTTPAASATITPPTTTITTPTTTTTSP